ncbi:MAG: carotenoid oxygenase family protein [Verrucomicrobiae bacterium]|nr:carotenoid oxygenase family protein [Verrucomicrobiae bacterium]
MMKHGKAGALSGYHRSLTASHGFEPVRVEGKLPDMLRGTLFRNGPALFEHGGRRHGHVFEGDGAVCAVRFSDEAVECAHRLIESVGLQQEREAGEALFGSAAPWLRRMRNGWKQKFKNTANTSVWRWQDRLFALMERGEPTEFDPETLDTIGTTTLDGLVAGGFSAHPHRVKYRRADYNFGLVPGRNPYIQLMELPWEGAPRTIGRIDLDHYVMMHDFIATENHLVFFIAPVKLQILRALLGSNNLEKLFQFDPDSGTEIVIVPTSSPAEQVRFQVDAFWQWHFAGAYEQGSGIVVDFVKHPDFGSLGELGQTQRSGLGRLTRAFIDPATRTMREEPLWDCACEYPRIDPRFDGGKHSHIFVSYDVCERVLARVNTTTGAVNGWNPPAHQYPSELVMIPRSNRTDEGDGYAISLIYDELEDRSHVAILDTARFEDGPVARVHLGHPVPMTFHGTWVPDGDDR